MCFCSFSEGSINVVPKSVIVIYYLFVAKCLLDCSSYYFPIFNRTIYINGMFYIS